MSPKIVELEQVSHRCDKLRADGKRLVATNGCFDLLHAGHVRYLQAARALGDFLAIGLNGDNSVRELKGSGVPLQQRAIARSFWRLCSVLIWSRFFHSAGQRSLLPQSSLLFMSKVAITGPKRWTKRSTQC